MAPSRTHRTVGSRSVPSFKAARADAACRVARAIDRRLRRRGDARLVVEDERDHPREVLAVAHRAEALGAAARTSG